jgi:hypothetical protein
MACEQAGNRNVRQQLQSIEFRRFRPDSRDNDKVVAPAAAKLGLGSGWKPLDSCCNYHDIVGELRLRGRQCCKWEPAGRCSWSVFPPGDQPHHIHPHRRQDML